MMTRAMPTAIDRDERRLSTDIGEVLGVQNTGEARAKITII